MNMDEKLKEILLAMYNKVESIDLLLTFVSMFFFIWLGAAISILGYKTEGILVTIAGAILVFVHLLPSKADKLLKNLKGVKRNERKNNR